MANLSEKMISLVKYIVLVASLCHWSCGAECEYFGNMTCKCSNTSFSCDGLYDENYDIFLTLTNLSYTSDLDSVRVAVQGLNLSENAAFPDMGTRELKLGFGLGKLNDDLFVGFQRSLVYLDLQNNNITSFPSNALRVLSELEYLDLSHNKIVTLSELDTKGLQRLKVLKLQHNKISLIINAFSSLGNLEILNLDSNNLNYKLIDQLKNLTKLKELSFSSNYIVELPADAVESLHSLRKLVIDNNKMSSFTRMNISSTSLEEFSASNCSIQGTLSKSIFWHLPNLKVLDLSHNNLTEITRHALFQLRKLEVLNLSKSNVEIIRDDAFSFTHNLRELNLESNGLIVVQDNVFHNLTRLKTLRLNDNRLVEFLCSYTADLLDLEWLELSRNKLKVVHTGTFMRSPNLRVLKLDGNAFDCNATCEAEYFSSYLRNNSLMNQTDIDAVLCQTPTYFKGQKMVEVSITKPLMCRVLDPADPCLADRDDMDDDEDYDYSDSTTTAFENETESTETSTSSLLPTLPHTLPPGTVTNTSTITDETDTTPTDVTQSSTLDHTSHFDLNTLKTETVDTESTPTSSATSQTQTESTESNPLSSAISQTETESTPRSSTTSQTETETTESTPPTSTTSQTEIETTESTPPTSTTSQTETESTESTPPTSTTSQTETESNSSTLELADPSKSSSLFTTPTEPVTTQDIHATDSTYIENNEYEVITTPEIFYNVFNFTYFNVSYLNSTSVLVEWKLNKKESHVDCRVKLFVEDRGIEEYPCSNKSITVPGTQKDTPSKFCITANHVMINAPLICKYLHSPQPQGTASKSRSSASTAESALPFNVLIGLIVIMICCVLLIAAYQIRKRCETSRYNVSEEENNVEKREGLRNSDNTFRTSYMVHETFDEI